MAHAWDEAVRIIGHRGSPREAPENTLASFAAAAAAGADAIELDVHLSADDEVIVHHDAELGRVIPGSGDIAALRADALVELGIPRLRDVLEAYPGLVDVELKPDGRDAERLPERVADVVTRAGALDRVLVTSFDAFLASEYAELTGRPSGLVSFFPLVPEDVEDLPLVRHVLLAQDACDAETVTGMREAGRIVSAWTVNELGAAEALVDVGVTGLITDRPGALAGLRRRRGDAAR